MLAFIVAVHYCVSKAASLYTDILDCTIERLSLIMKVMKYYKVDWDKYLININIFIYSLEILYSSKALFIY
jgi:hypothetical protein